MPIVVVTLLVILRLIILSPRRIFEKSQSGRHWLSPKNREREPQPCSSVACSLALKISFDKTDNAGKHR